MRRSWRLFAAAAVFTVAAFPFALAARADDPLPAAPTRWVTDQAGFLSGGARQSLDAQLQAYEQRSGHQVLVWIGKSSGSYTPEDFASKAFAAWRVGRANIDDGLVLFVFADERKLRFEVGYGLESKIPDVVAGKILRDDIVPRLQAGDRDGAIQNGIAAAIAVLDGTAAPSPSASPADSTDSGSASQQEPATAKRSLSMGEKIVIGLLIVGFIILLITNPSLALWLLFNLLSSGGGSRGGGGGFSGGGGRSGGGGASGSW